jgi:endothelin-converting enzyme/putative endopeptidase
VRRLLALVAILALAGAGCRRARPRPTGDAPYPPIDETALDRSVPACEDFYQFACGGWLARTPIPAERSSWSRGFSELEERNLRQLRRILEDAAAGKVDPRDRFGEKLGDFYASCMDEVATEARGLADLRAEWARVDAVEDRASLAAELARLEAVGISAPFTLVADQDARDATQVILLVYQGGLTLPDRDYYLTDAGKNPEIRRRYGEHLRAMLRLAGVSPAEVDAQAAMIEDLERALAASQWTQVEMRDPSRIYNRVDRAGLDRLAPAFPWARLFEGLGHPGLAAVSVTTPPFIQKVAQLYERAPLETWKAYLRWRITAAMADARALPRAFVEERFRFDSVAFSGATALRPRWKHCVDAADEALGFALGQPYVRKHFGADGKERTSRLVGEIEKAMERDLDALPWMDRATRAAALQKLARIANKVGYPDTWRDYSALRVNRKSYFKNVLSASRFETNRQLTKVGKPVDRAEWLMSPPTVNAYYNPSMNEMVFPAGILQPPFFSRSAPEEVNSGAIGMVVGHELTHGFDDAGRQYDAEGNLRDWWTLEVARRFEEKSQCLVRQYSSYEPIPGVKLDGELTLGENIADLGGLKLAFSAMHAALAGRPEANHKLLGFTPDQQFFLGFAQSWCASFREENVRLRAATDPHAPPRFRVNGPLSNLPEFAAAFECEEGSPMVRPAAARCEVW